MLTFDPKRLPRGRPKCSANPPGAQRDHDHSVEVGEVVERA
jgi:hypothetical protein